MPVSCICDKLDGTIRRFTSFLSLLFLNDKKDCFESVVLLTYEFVMNSF